MDSKSQQPQDTTPPVPDDKPSDAMDKHPSDRPAAVRRPGPLHHLPSKVLSLICQEALEETVWGEKRPNHRQALLHLGRTCKRLNQIVQRLLYREITTNDPTNILPWERFRSVDLGKLIHTLSVNPNLGQHIRHISLGSAVRSARVDSRYFHLVDSDMRIEHMGVDQTDKWVVRALFGTSYAEGNPLGHILPHTIGEWHKDSPVPTFLLMRLAPKMCSANIYVNERWSMDGVLNLRSVERGDLGLGFKLEWPALTRLALIYPSKNQMMPPGKNRIFRPGKIVQSLLVMAPNLKELTLRRFLDLERREPWGPFRFPSELTSLVLDQTFFSANTLRHIASTTGHLTRICINYTKGPLPPSAQLADLVDALTPAAGTLQRLELDSDHYNRKEDEALPERQKRLVQRLGSFPNLQVLGINLLDIDHVGDHALVDLVRRCPKLEGLVLKGANGAPRNTFLCFAESVSKRMFANLRKVKLVASSSPFLQFDIRLLEELKEVLAETPVRELFRIGNVELIVETCDYQDSVRPFADMEGRLWKEECPVYERPLAGERGKR